MKPDHTTAHGHLLTIAETALFLRTPESTVRSWMSRGQLGKDQGLIYVQSKPFFLADVLKEQRNNGLLGKKRKRRGPTT